MLGLALFVELSNIIGSVSALMSALDEHTFQ